WFGRNRFEDYDSGRLTQPDYKKQVQGRINSLWRGLPLGDTAIEDSAQQAVTFQQQFCDAVILPSPLTMQLNTSCENELDWLDAGLKAVATNASTKRAYATVAISDVCTSSVAPENSPLIEVLLDHVSAREPDGVYLIIEQRHEAGYYIASPSTIRTVLRLIFEFKEAGIRNVFVCWLGTAGLLALAAGADDWAT